MNSICFCNGTTAKLVFAGLLLALFPAAWFPAPVDAAEGDPIAVRLWPGGTVTVEAHWGLSVAVQNAPASPAGSTPASDSDTNAIPPTDATVGLGQAGTYLLRRPANQAKPTWQSVAISDTQTSDVSETPNDIRVNLLGTKAVHLQLDGVHLIVAGPDCDAQTLESIEHIDAVIGSDLQRFAAEDGKSLPTTVRNWISESATAPDSAKVRSQNHNTVAISSLSPESQTKSPAVWWNVSPQPWVMPEAMDKMFVAMEKSCSESQAVFSALTAEQMNFQPANGTHTPRWNVEHMMGRQLQFFSQMYHTADAAIPVMDLNPAQMPPDYRFANPNWSGAEEARQMQRVSEFSRRFAYLLDGYGTDDKVPGSRWPTLGALLKQMERHYSEHTANTQKKFQLPGWPSQN
ncbi:DinB family protein [Rhodopirellula sp. P2]|uniref:DinB family protein n=1 Tax=Rhodopirellula sp. P2 TaxID=2127060 RepID=UPI0023679EB6|nr:DinB family protein [Rhodopirellula sp. P2]WDQ14691.1 DinB family protein [Rhodopirellula sp. P2]